MLYIGVPQRARLKVSYQMQGGRLKVDSSDILSATVAAMNKVTPGAVHVPLTSIRTEDGIDLWVVRLSAPLVSRIRSSHALRSYIAEGPVMVVVVSADNFTASIVPPKDVAYLDADGIPVMSAIQLTTYVRGAILEEKNVSVKSEHG